MILAMETGERAHINRLYSLMPQKFALILHVGACEPGAKEILFTANIPAGRTTLQAWFQDEQNKDLCGAFYARITYKSP